MKDIGEEDTRVLLARVDQNVINLIKIFDEHAKSDREFQEQIRQELGPIKTELSERRGAIKFASIAYGIISGLIGAIIGVKYGHG